MEISKPQYFIGVDTYDNGVFVYCLAKRTNDISETLLLKKMRDKDAFEEEVSNLAKYFNAVTVKEK
jgi:hypothetical protein